MGVRITISSSPVELSSRLLNRAPRTGILPRSGTWRIVLSLVSLVTPPTTRRWPWPTSTSVSWRRLKMDGLPWTVREKSGSLFSKFTFMRILVSPSSLMTRGVTSSLSSASLNWTCVPPSAELLTYGTSKPREMRAFAFSTVTALGSASLRPLPWTSSAWMARLRLKFCPRSPSRMPPAGLAPARVGSNPVGRFTRLPPSGVACVSELIACPPVLPVLGVVKPEPTTIVPLPTLVALSNPHCTPICSSALRVVMTIWAAIWTWGTGMSRLSKISFLIRSRSRE